MQSAVLRFLLARIDPHVSLILSRIIEINGLRLDIDMYLAAAILGAYLVFTILFVAITLFLEPGAPFVIACALQPIAYLATLVGPLACVVLANFHAATRIQTKSSPIFMMTNVSGRAVFQAYYLAMLYRLRSWFITGAILMPLLAVAQAMGSFLYTSRFVPYPAPTFYLPQILLAIMNALHPFRVLGINLMSVALGLVFGIKSRSVVEGAVLGICTMLVYVLADTLILLPFQGSMLLAFSGVDNPPFQPDIIMLIVAILATVLPFVAVINTLSRDWTLLKTGVTLSSMSES